ncbi:MAG: hypothetical protein K5870_01010 [Lachnospiraceae bacterium]|nr:hypothetical protein [Lachnospiraceae bacterium]
MADISQDLLKILQAVYGEEVRGAIYHALDLMNQVTEAVFVTGTEVTSSSSSSEGYFPDTTVYLNLDTFELWKCVGVDTWQSLGVLKGPKGDDGADGTTWYHGTTISGGAVLPTVYPSSGIADANAGDFYLNYQDGPSNTDGYVYMCITGGDANHATWSYKMSLSGGGGAIVLNDLNDVSIDAETLETGQLLEYDAVEGVFKNVSDKTFVRYGGSINFADLVTYASTYLAAGYEDTFFLLRTGGTIGTGEAAQYWTSNFRDGDEIPADAHIAVININRGTMNPPVYRYDDFGGFVDISGKADKSELALKADKTELDDWIETTPPTQVSNGSFTFNDVNDTNNDGYMPWIGVSASTVNKNPSAQITAISGTGTSNMSVTYSTDADEGAVVKLRRLK